MPPLVAGRHACWPAPVPNSRKSISRGLEELPIKAATSFGHWECKLGTEFNNAFIKGNSLEHFGETG
jgi:hypothetical protein